MGKGARICRITRPHYRLCASEGEPTAGIPVILLGSLPRDGQPFASEARGTMADQEEVFASVARQRISALGGGIPCAGCSGELRWCRGMGGCLRRQRPPRPSPVAATIQAVIQGRPKHTGLAS